MAKRTRKSKAVRRESRARRVARGLRRWLLRGMLGAVVLGLGWVGLYAVVAPPTTPYILAEARRLDSVSYDWVPMDQISPHLQRAAVAAEDANFCLHWGFDMDAIRAAIDAGAARGGSTISQQVVKNAFLWHGRSWLRKALEAAITPVMEAFWPKRRVLEVYLNIAEFAPGIFGAEAAAQHHFGISAADLSQRQAALLAAVLPNPGERSASAPSAWVERRATSIAEGAATIRADGRDACFAN
ncbi:Monofunctional biosynthetic peptidoglycan transglycosylase [Roseibacterium elongatum DSM 19469]|uniref:Biosynthetic peptidoglycan transglycosylase n=1 Tax=Roseicyclus elongatus DSM 19469 TaxID=1294273 RepID=W8S3P4_9RHOB|nr:monofunctional biosynthetic peptidoglycan transglycosylase [Roseibacterium elongatum]AHM03381.1 Monofunctional biosynthetic peptidoglycan transglycosylase [Roseibacterium elongatum DSM 19469]